MSSFYLDIIKDRLYADAADDSARKASQTVLYDALLAITKLIAPILPHTADEVWKYIPGVELDSVQISELPEIRTDVYNQELEQKWDGFLNIRDEVLKALEEARKNKTIGNSLSAAVDLYPSDAAFKLLSGFDKLDTLFIVSAATLHNPSEKAPEGSYEAQDLAVQVSVAEGEKCERCWIVTPEVGQNKEHPTLCARCAEVVSRLE